MHDNAEYVREGVRAGASGYLLKDSAAAELRLAVRAVHAGGTYFSTPAARGLTAPPSSAPDGEADEPPSSDVLTARERDVLDGIARGLTNKEIAGQLGISHRTVETHRESLMRKLGIRTGGRPHPLRARPGPRKRDGAPALRGRTDPGRRPAG
jgi:DNA-binding NarL/FixJ family response regulator